MDKTVRIVGLSGSLRRGSYNSAAVRAAQALLPENAELQILDLAQIPFFNEDLEAEGMPSSVAELRAALEAADAVLMATPEYNFSLPPVLKNALDWASRGDKPPLAGKPVAIMSASIGWLGGARVQYHLRQVCGALNMLPLNRPEVFIGNAQEKFDEEGNLIDQRTQRFIRRLLEALVQRVREMRD
jgi:chromate reductase